MKIDFIYKTTDGQRFLITGNIKSKTDYTTTFEVSKGREGLLFFLLMEKNTQVFEYSDKYSIQVDTDNIVSWLGLPWNEDCPTDITELNK